MKKILILGSNNNAALGIAQDLGSEHEIYTFGFKEDFNKVEYSKYIKTFKNVSKKDSIEALIDSILKYVEVNKIEIIIPTNDIVDNYLDVTNNSSFPVGFNNSILNIIYKQAASEGIDLMFDGDGADRLFLGMNKYLQLKQILKLYNTSKSLNINKLLVNFLSLVKHPSTQKLSFYFEKFNKGYSFYGERKLPNSVTYIDEFEVLLNSIALPKELKEIGNSIDSWLFFSLFSVYYTPGFFFHTPYELQLKHNIVSNPQFWSDDLVQLALSIPVEQKLHKKTTKKVLRDAAKIKIDDGYWNLSKIGLQNSYSYLKQSKYGLDFVHSYKNKIEQSDEYLFLKETIPGSSVETERLLPYIIWKEKNTNLK